LGSSLYFITLLVANNRLLGLNSRAPRPDFWLASRGHIHNEQQMHLSNQTTSLEKQHCLIFGTISQYQTFGPQKHLQLAKDHQGISSLDLSNPSVDNTRRPADTEASISTMTQFQTSGPRSTRKRLEANVHSPDVMACHVCPQHENSITY
jgi:hypothetical protein